MTDGLEIERKFLLDRVPPHVDPATAVRIRQGYIVVTDNIEVRLRAVGDASSLTIKGGRGLVRREVTVPLDAARFETLWPLTAGRRLSKRRATIKHDDTLLEIDIFDDDLAGLMLVEVEFDSQAASEAFAAPAWFGREVTDDARYSNAALAAGSKPPGATG